MDRHSTGSVPDTSPVGIRVARNLQHVPALDGVRGVAVALVVLYHLGLPAPGGFLGVDLFFVLSGFLITTLLLREWASDGRIDLIRFWLRRARRLLPALFVLLIVAAVVASKASPFDKSSLRWDLLSSLGYVANWRFILAGQSYFQEFTAPSPVRALWSLAIEEQFYIVWPLIAFGSMAFLRRATGRRRLIVPVVFVAAAAASVASLALRYDQFDPSAAYYATDARVHELLVGAGAAVLFAMAPRVVAFVERHAGWIAAISLALIILAGAAFSDSSSLYYFGGSLLFSLCCAALVLAVVAGADSRGPAIRLLRLRPVVWLGAVSYGVYLWHWPLIVWLTPAVTHLDGPALLALRVSATLVVVTLSYYIVERPIRRGTIRGVRLGAKVVFAATLVCAVVIASTVVISTRGSRPLPPYLSANVTLVRNVVPQAHGTIGMVGDSVAMSLYPGFAYVAAERGISVSAATFPGCSLGQAIRVDEQGKPFWNAKSCPKTAVKEQNAMIAEDNPSIVFWLSARDRYDILQNGRVLTGGSHEWEVASFADWDRALSRLTARGAHIVLIMPLAGTGGNPAECTTVADLSRTKCTRPLLKNGGLRLEYRRWAAQHPDQVTVLEPDDVLCPGNANCPATLDGVKLRVADGVHYTPTGAIVAARRLFPLVPVGLWP